MFKVGTFRGVYHLKPPKQGRQTLVTVSETLFHIPVVSVARIANAPTIARMINDMISPYSTAVAPRESRANQRKKRVITRVPISKPALSLAFWA